MRMYFFIKLRYLDNLKSTSLKFAVFRTIKQFNSKKSVVFQQNWKKTLDEVFHLEFETLFNFQGNLIAEKFSKAAESLNLWINTSSWQVLLSISKSYLMLGPHTIFLLFCLFSALAGVRHYLYQTIFWDYCDQMPPKLI